jgi:hypothetical protein
MNDSTKNTGDEGRGGVAGGSVMSEGPGFAAAVQSFEVPFVASGGFFLAVVHVVPLILPFGSFAEVSPPCSFASVAIQMVAPFCIMLDRLYGQSIFLSLRAAPLHLLDVFAVAGWVIIN